MNNTQLATGDNLSRNLPLEQEVTGSGGNVKITADSLEMTFSSISSGSFGGNGGDVSLQVGNIEMQSSFMEVTGLLGSGGFTANANRFVITDSVIEADTAFGTGKPITITANVVELTNGGAIRSHTLADANGGDIIVTAADHITLSDPRPSSIPSGLYASAVGSEDAPGGGHSGSGILTTPTLVINGGARIDTSTETSGQGGNITVTANSVSISGERAARFPIIEDGLISPTQMLSGIFSRSVGTQFCSGLCGKGGHVSITTGSLTLANGGQINSDTVSTGHGGDVTVSASGQVLLSGTMTDGTPSGIFVRTTGPTQTRETVEPF